MRQEYASYEEKKRTIQNYASSKEPPGQTSPFSKFLESVKNLIITTKYPDCLRPRQTATYRSKLLYLSRQKQKVR